MSLISFTTIPSIGTSMLLSEGETILTSAGPRSTGLVQPAIKRADASAAENKCLIFINKCDLTKRTVKIVIN